MASVKSLTPDAAAPVRDPTVTVSASKYRRLLLTADMAPLDVLPIPPAHLKRASTLGYTHVRSVRLRTRSQLVLDLGEDATDSILSVLDTYGLAELA